jgi:carbohydrate-selective porin OprB
LTLCLAFVLFCATNALCQEPDSIGKSADEAIDTASLQSRITTLEKKVADHDLKVVAHDTIIEELRKNLHREFGTPAIQGQGFTIGVNATMVMQETDNPNAVSAEAETVSDASYAAEVTFAKDFDKVNGKAFLRYEAGQGNGINQDLSLLSVSNASAYPGQGIWVAEAWYEQKLFAGKFDGTIGYLFPAVYFDNNAAANDQTTQFLSAIFVNNPTIEMPVYTPGFVVKIAPIDKVELSGAMFDAKAGWQRIGEHLLNFIQASCSPVIAGSAGNYHLYAWANRLPHRSWGDSGATNEMAYGFGASADQQFTDELTAFARFGWRNPENYDPTAVAQQTYATLIAESWSAGVEIAGKRWHRENDVAGIGFGQAFPSAKYTTALALANGSPESHLEIFYRIKCFEHMGISPDIQYIINPFGNSINPFSTPVNGNTDNMLVLGIRSMVDF